MTLYSGDTFTHKDHTFRIEIEHDPDIDEPWKEQDGHGIVSDWTRRDKSPGERVLCKDRSSKRYYDFQGTLARARKDGWGLYEAERAKLEQKLGRVPTKKEITAAAVELDFEHLRAWCNDDWQWCYIKVTMLDEDENETDYTESIGGVESNAREHIQELARELADGCIGQWQQFGETVNE